MTVTTNMYTFVSRVGRSPKRAPRSPSPTNSLRSNKVKDILNIVRDMGWIVHHTNKKNGEDYFWFEKDDSWIPIILENHSSDSKTEKGYLTTYCCRGGNMRDGVKPPTWNNKHILNYSLKVKELGWEQFGNSPSRKKLDCINLNDEMIEKVLKMFETIHE